MSALFICLGRNRKKKRDIMTFTNRDRLHSEYKRRVSDFFRNRYGFLVTDYGQETNISKTFSDALFKCGNNPTAHFIRYKPDSAIIITKPSSFNRAYLVEIKSKNPSSPNVAIELDSLEHTLALWKIGVKVILVLPEFKALWSKDVQFFRIDVPDRNPIEIYESIKQKYSPVPVEYRQWNKAGSGTPYGLVNGQNPDITDLDNFIESELLND
ncbi:MAG: hypothetical protein AB1349_10265 [Elusimicrobiota bacterium]